MIQTVVPARSAVAKPTVPTVPPEPEPESDFLEPEPAPKREFANEVRLTVHLSTPEMRYTADGRVWTRARAFLSMGKDKDGKYKPSLWLTIKAFVSRDGDDSLPYALNSFDKGDLVTVKGRLAYEEYTNAKGETRGELILIASAIE